ncbi:tail fiber domain-containing protein [Lacinutrix iliipiscaria]|uniref:Tail fiber domain-containing protein n=1 Tax=Lacinutrix iliipiscaria TaxID=1230532 RepID=A0ABW5WM47_9FLAO
MKVIFSMVILLLSSFGFAQDGINYKSIIKDNLGNVIANQTVDVQFTILQGVAQTNVYQETHSPTTDVNGLLVVNIGEGTTSDVFTDISWGDDDHFLNVQIDTGSGLTDMGTTQFMVVPYALHAKNVSGLEALDEGNGVGYRLKDSNPVYYGNIGDRAVDLSYGGDTGYDAGQGAVGTGSVAMGQYTTANVGSVAMGYGSSATGQYATAMGSNTIASGPFSVAMGEASTASGISATAMGYNTEASGQTATAMGLETEASGENSTALGNATNAIGENSLAAGELTLAIGKTSTAIGNGINANGLLTTAIGRFNTGGGDPTTWVDTDPLFEIGNGASFGAKSNALTVLKNGTITAPSFDISEITDNKALITKEYADANYTGGGGASTGLEALDEGNGRGWRLIGRDPANYGNIGFNAVDFSYGLTDNYYGALGQLSFSSGYLTRALGESSFSAGSSTSALGYSSFAANSSTEANGNSSSAFGFFTQSDAYASFAIGGNNIGGGSIDNWVETDPLFEIGNSNQDGVQNRSNALTVLKNGTITAPSFDMSEITDNKALITKEYLEANGASGLEAIDEGNGIGWRLKGSNPDFYGNIGLGAIDFSRSSGNSSSYGALGLYSFATGLNSSASGTNAIALGRNTRSIGSRSVAIGQNATSSGIESIAIGANATTDASGQRAIAIGNNVLASGNNSFASGYYTSASGESSTSMGNQTEATGDSSMAMGEQTVASGYASTALGNITVASGFSATAMGFETIADDQFSTVVGRLNDNTTTTSALFQIGNGTSGGRSNAFTALMNGHIGIGTDNPGTLLHIEGLNNVGLASGTGLFMVGYEVGNNLVFDGNEIQARLNGAATNLHLQYHGGNVAVGGTLVHSSDRRLKKDIEDLNYGLNEILALSPKAYNWKNREQDYKSMGLIAQEVQSVINEIVHIADDENKTLSVSYTELIPVLINAIQEQQQTINTLKKNNSDKDEVLANLNGRLQNIEKLLSINK